MCPHTCRKGSIMKKSAKTALLLAMSLLFCQPLYSCSKKQDESSVAESSSTAVNDGVQPTTSADEAELGEYVFSESGIKLYYDESEFAEEVDVAGIVAALEKYFVSFSQADYDTYLECIHSEYITQMNAYLEKDYGYDLETSFNKQCETLKSNAGGDYTITRLKVQSPAEDGSEDYLTYLGELYGTDFYNTVKEDSDALHDLIFYVMVEAEGVETLLISEFEIVFAEKDGKYYAFG